MIAFGSQNAERDYREASAKIHGSNSTYRTCCKCGARRPRRELEVVNSGPYTRFNPQRRKCKGGCDVR